MYANSGHESHDRVDRSISVARSGSQIDSQDHNGSQESIGGLHGTYPCQHCQPSTWGIDRGINRQIKIDHGINRKIESHEQSWEFLGNGCPGCPYPWGTGQVGQQVHVL